MDSVILFLDGVSDNLFDSEGRQGHFRYSGAIQCGGEQKLPVPSRTGLSQKDSLVFLRGTGKDDDVMIWP